MPKFTIQTPIPIDEVPVPKGRHRTNQFLSVFNQLGDLHRGKAMPITVSDAKAGLYVRSALRKIAMKNGELLSSSRSDDQLTWYFWLEPKDVVADLAITKRKAA